MNTKSGQMSLKKTMLITAGIGSVILALGGYVTLWAVGVSDARTQITSAVVDNSERSWSEMCDFSAVQQGIADWSIAEFRSSAQGQMMPAGILPEKEILSMVQQVITPKTTVSMIDKTYGASPDERRKAFEQAKAGARSFRIVESGMDHIQAQWSISPDGQKLIKVSLARTGFMPGSPWKVRSLTLPTGMIGVANR